MKIKKLFRRERVIEALKNIRAIRFKASHSSIMHVSLLFLILFLAFLIRMLPLRWGLYLSEFDPYYQYRLTEHMVNNGFFSWASWHDYMSWYPYGRDVGRTSFPGLAFTASSLYLIVNALGFPISLFEFCVIFPAIMATLTCLVMYFLGKDIGGKEVGLFSAFFLALNSSHISRTSLGFFDDETIGIFGILLFIFFFLRSIETERPLKSNAIYAVAAGLSLGYLLASWGASRYPIGMVVLFVVVLILLRRYTPLLLFSYSASFGAALFVAINIPLLGPGFLTEVSVLPVLGVFLLLCACEINRRIKTLKMKIVFLVSFFALIAVFFVMLSWFGYIGAMGAKFMSVLNPYERLGHPLVESVQEHRPAAWGSFYYDLGIGAFFVPMGLFFAMRNPTNRNIFISIFGLTSVYFAGSMVRLTLLMAPAFCLLWALALVQLLRPFITVMREVPVIPVRKMRFAAHVGKEFSGALLIVMFLLLAFTFVLPNPRVFDHAYSPTTIASAGVPLKSDETVTDWIYALTWMREKLPPTAIVASWWDYGYWITTLGNKTSIADNATFNWTQIQNIGLMFMSNETEAIKILKKYDATHVVVFTTFSVSSPYTDVGWGDEGKWRWMARIAGQRYPFIDEDNYGSYDEETGEWTWSDLGKSTVIYTLMTYAKETRVGEEEPSVYPMHFDLVYVSQGPAIAGYYYAVVGIYEVLYD